MDKHDTYTVIYLFLYFRFYQRRRRRRHHAVFVNSYLSHCDCQSILENLLTSHGINWN